MLPEISRQPTLHNPFPELSKVAVAPFFNLSQEPTVDGRGVAEAYFNELQSVPGFEVIPVGVVENAMRAYQIDLNSPSEARRLAQLLEADALVVGAVTDYSPWYPPRLGLQVQWYSANPCFHPIPPGYGLPWGTPEEEGIPGRLVFEAELALAKAQLKTQTPVYEPLPQPERSPDIEVLPDQGSEADDGGGRSTPWVTWRTCSNGRCRPTPRSPQSVCHPIGPIRAGSFRRRPSSGRLHAGQPSRQ